MTIFLPMTFARDQSKEVNRDGVSYLATAQRRAPSALREDDKRVLVVFDACDGSIAIGKSDSFGDSTYPDGKRFSRFLVLGRRDTPDVSYLSTENFLERGTPPSLPGQGRKVIWRDAEKRRPHRLIKNVKMQGTRNSEK
jgi:hypothetical protein